MTETAPPLFNPFAPGSAEDPYPQYAALRDVADAIVAADAGR